MESYRDNTEQDKIFRKKIFLSMVVPLSFIILIWLILFLENQLELSLSFLGIYPRELRGLAGVITSPLIHHDFEHLINNTVPLFVLGTAVFYFYSEIAFNVSLYSWLITGLFVWIAGREAWHIGASGLLYSLASFLFFSGFIRKYFRLIALSLLVVFLYGSMVWGMFPLIDIHVSWESHMLGAGTGLILAILYRRKGPQRKLPDWYYEEDDEEDDEEDYLVNYYKQENLTDKYNETGI
ncbi:MAG TPA: rhomboid family intramembrane serine protease [Bacteroidales bacterium]|nr:rhomboid family intramembrane serine protease [Bacteroidales bacterium]